METTRKQRSSALLNNVNKQYPVPIKHMKKLLHLPYTSFLSIFLCMSIMLCSQQLRAATLQAVVDQNTITINETIVLTVILDKQGGDDIDFSPLQLQFDILNSQRSSQTSIVNGRATSKTEWNLILSPKETGKLIIPSFSVNGIFSQALTIDVIEKSTAKPHTSVAPQEVYLKASIDKNSVYVQEQILLHLRLYYRTSLSGYDTEDLIIDGATVTLTSEKNYQTMENGFQYNVLEKTYALHPQKSGVLTIPSQVWQLEKASRNFGFGFRQQSSPYLRVNSEPQTIKVKTAPKHSTAKDWLPATSVTLEQQWQQSIITAKVGEPLTYSLTINAEGLHFSQIPSIDLNSTPELTIYADQAKTDNQLTLQGITGQRIESYAIIPKKSGKLTLPEITFQWWNTKTDKEETITLTQQTIIVASNNTDNHSPAISPDSQTNNGVNNTANTEKKQTITSKRKPDNLWLWQLTTILLGFVSVVLLLLYRRQKILASKHQIESNTTTSDRKFQAAQLNHILKNIDQAIENKQWVSVKHYLLQWFELITKNKVEKATDIKAYCHDIPEIISAIDALDIGLYGKEPLNNHALSAQLASLTILLKNNSKRIRKRNHHESNSSTNQLNALYPS